MVVCLGAYFSSSIIWVYELGVFDRTYSTADLIKNFNLKKSEIYDVKKYTNDIVPKYKNVDIEFENDREIAVLVITPIDTGRGSDLTAFEDWNLKIGSKKVDSLLAILGWKNETLTTIKRKLDDANCISIATGEPAKIGFKRSGMGMYFFNVFDNPISDTVRSKYYSDSCLYIYVNKKLILEYGGGAVGPQCFPRQDPNTKPR